MGMLRLGVSGAVLAVALLVNPMYACHPAGPDHARIARRMATTVVGTWELRFHDGAPTRRLVVTPAPSAPPPATARRASLVATASACGSYTVIASAAACHPAWKLPLLVRQVDGGPASEGTGHLEESDRETQLALSVGDLAIDVPMPGSADDGVEVATVHGAALLVRVER